MMLRVLFFVILAAALSSTLIGYLGTRVMPAIDRTTRTDIEGVVAAAAWPSLTVKSGAREWKLLYWPPHPRFEAGQKVSIAITKSDETEASLHDVGDWPLRYLSLGGLVAILSIFALRAVWYSGPALPPGAMPEFPVTLHESRVVAYVILGFGSICVIGSIAALIFLPSEAPWYAYLHYLAGLAIGALLTWGGMHLVSGNIVVTEEEIVETSRVATLHVALDQVKSIEREPIYGEKQNRRLPGPDPIVGWMLVFKGANGAELYRSSTNLEPRDDYQKVLNYLFNRFPVETKP
jgi:hypothetical protein